MSVAWVAVGASVLGTAVSASSSSKASKAQGTAAQAASLQQQQAADAANALQRQQYETSRQDSAPWVNTGAGALNQLAWKMGITPTNTVPLQPDVNKAPESDTPGGSDNPLWERIVSANWANHVARYGIGWDTNKTTQAERDGNYQSMVGAYNRQKDADPELAAYAAKLSAKNEAGRYKGDQADFGSLARNFTTADLNADPVYQSGLQFGLDQGTQGINRQNAASGSQLSGATLKALARYGNDYGSTKAQGAYERFGTNQATQFNRLSGIAGTGQQQVNQIGAAGQNYAGNVGNNLIGTAGQIGQNTIGAADARAASYMQTARSINSAIGTGINTYQQNQYLNNMGSNTGTNSLYTGGGYTPDYSFSGARLGNG